MKIGLMMACQKANKRKTIIRGAAGMAVFIIAVNAASTAAIAQNNKHSCTIIVDNSPGIMRQNADTSVLASTLAGGQSARAQIIATNARYRASVDAPSGFSVFPNQGNYNTEFSASFSSSGATQFLSTPHNVERKIKKGTSNINVHMSARRLNGSFPAGNYAATVTLRCE